MGFGVILKASGSQIGIITKNVKSVMAQAITKEFPEFDEAKVDYDGSCYQYIYLWSGGKLLRFLFTNYGYSNGLRVRVSRNDTNLSKKQIRRISERLDSLF